MSGAGTGAQFFLNSGLSHTGEIPFAEDNGSVHIFSASGRHLKTVDLETGRAGRDRFAFGYDQNDRIVSVSDRFGNSTVIERDAGDGYDRLEAVSDQEQGLWQFAQNVDSTGRDAIPKSMQESCESSGTPSFSCVDIGVDDYVS